MLTYYDDKLCRSTLRNQQMVNTSRCISLGNSSKIPSSTFFRASTFAHLQGKFIEHPKQHFFSWVRISAALDQICNCNELLYTYVAANLALKDVEIGSNIMSDACKMMSWRHIVRCLLLQLRYTDAASNNCIHHLQMIRANLTYVWHTINGCNLQMSDVVYLWSDKHREWVYSCRRYNVLISYSHDDDSEGWCL